MPLARVVPRFGIKADRNKGSIRNSWLSHEAQETGPIKRWSRAVGDAGFASSNPVRQLDDMASFWLCRPYKPHLFFAS